MQEDMKRIPYLPLVEAVCHAMEENGIPHHIALIESEIMAESDLMGVPSHGVRMLPALFQGIREGRANAHPSLSIIRDRAATCVLDGDRGPGRYTSVQAMQCAVARAEQFGIGACLAVRVSHWGRAFSYAYRGTQSGMIGICMTNAIPNMVSWNSSRPLLANNPLAIGVPRKERFPVVLDMAMSQAAMGKIGTYAREGKPAPDHWGLDEHGNPTNDPKRILDGKRILPFGEHKGTGLGLMIEILTGALSGTMLSQEIVEQDASGLDSNSSKLFIAVNISDFSSLEQLSGKIEQLAEWLHATEPGADIIFPGDHSWKMRERFLQEGIPLHQEIVDALQSEGLHLP